MLWFYGTGFLYTLLQYIILILAFVGLITVIRWVYNLGKRHKKK